MNINIKVTNNFILEKEYIIRSLFKEIYEYDCKIEYINELSNITISYLDKELILKDDFFNHFNENISYIDRKNIPNKLLWFNNTFEDKQPIPMIYGENKFIVEGNRIYCGLDIFASSFFMLTRWEELVLPKDKFGRCDENEMFVVKHHIYNRPIVNEYIELLKSMLRHLGIEISKTKRKFNPLITHDIDYLFRYDFKNLCKNLVGDLLHRKSLSIMSSTIKNYYCFKRGKIKDPFDTFDKLMDLSDKYGLKNHFYFKAAIPKEHDETYNIFDYRVKNIMKNINKRGHYIGFHPSINTFNNSEQFSIELNRLRSLGFEIKGGRQHYLLYELPETIKVWNVSGVEYDAGLGFYSRIGFRCGTCYPYIFFDVINRKEIDFEIKPLIVMEAAIVGRVNYESIETKIKTLAVEVKKYNGNFVFLWHNDNFNRYEYRLCKKVYSNIIKFLGQLSQL